MLNQYGYAIVNQLSAHFKFDLDEAMRIANIGQVNVEKKTKISIVEKAPKEKTTKEPKDKKEKKEKVERIVPSFALPFCGVVMEDWCKGVRANHELYTQCTSAPTASDKFCKACRKAADGNDGVHPLGEISDRLEKGLMDYEIRGKKVVPYGNMLAKLGKTREEAIAEAARFGWEIAEEQFESRKGSRGRPRTNSDKNSGDDNEKKQRGRPRKAVEVVNGSAKGDDMIARLVRSAREEEDANSEAESENATEVENPWKAAAEAVTDKKVKSSALDKEAKKAAKEAEKAAAKAAKEAEKVAAKAAKDAEKAAAKANAKVNAKTADNKTSESKNKVTENQVPVVATQPSPVQSETSSAENQDDEGEIEVTEIKIKGKSYLMATNGKRKGKLYDRATNKGVGIWNDKTKKIDELPTDMISDDEDTEEDGDSE